MRGVKSEAMVMCATSPDGQTVEFLRPPPGSQPGDRVYFDGFEGGARARMRKARPFARRPSWLTIPCACGVRSLHGRVPGTPDAVLNPKKKVRRR